MKMAGMPTGTVQFKTNGVNFGSPVTLTGGSASSASASQAVPLAGDSLRHAVAWKERRLADLPPGRYLLTVEAAYLALLALVFYSLEHMEYFLNSGKYNQLQTYSLRGLPRPVNDATPCGTRLRRLDLSRTRV